MMRDYLSPERNRVALLTIDAQRDFCMSSGRGKAGCSAPFTAAMTRLTEGFRAKGRPIVHVVRLYRCDGSNVELCNRASIEEGQRIVMPGTSGAELLTGLKPDQDQRLDASLLLDGKFQSLGRQEWIMYKPRWSAFYQTPLEDHLKGQGITTLVICGCNFPNGPCTRAQFLQDGASHRISECIEDMHSVTDTLPFGGRQGAGPGPPSSAHGHFAVAAMTSTSINMPGHAS